MSKSRLKPIGNNTMTIPHLELQAAVLATRMKTTVLDELKLGVSKVYLWSDSKTVLKYIKNENVIFGKIHYLSNQ